jgi:hypothetical protein
MYLPFSGRECAQVLVRGHWSVAGSKLKTVYQKYMLPEFGSVARYPPATCLFELSESDSPSVSSQGKDKLLTGVPFSPPLVENHT